MVDVSTSTLVTRTARPNLDGGTHPSMAIAFLVLLVGGIIFTGYHLCADIQSAHVETTTWIPFLFLALALFSRPPKREDKQRARLLQVCDCLLRDANSFAPSAG